VRDTVTMLGIDYQRVINNILCATGYVGLLGKNYEISSLLI